MPLFAADGNSGIRTGRSGRASEDCASPCLGFSLFYTCRLNGLVNETDLGSYV